MKSEPDWRTQGNEPDYRFSLANERTFLAWIRTALAILAGAILLHEFASKIEPRWMVVVFSIALAVLAALLGAGAYQRWKGNEIAMRHSRALPGSPLMLVLSICVFVLSAVLAVLLILPR